MTDLEKLIEAVEAGLPSPTNWRDFAALPKCDVDTPAPILAHRAYYGSLDAAKALHEALLPEWDLMLTTYEDDTFEASVSEPLKVKTYDGVNSVLSRAWLLAILRAYAARDAA